MSSSYASDFNRRFELALILGNRNAPPLWDPPQWDAFIQAINPLMSVAGDNFSNSVSFARTRGKKRQLETFRSDEWRLPPSYEEIFYYWNTFGPSEKICRKEKRSPDVYISISNSLDISRVNLAFNPMILIALSSDIKDSFDLVNAAAENIATATSAVMTARQNRPWGFETDIGYNEGISETSWFSGSMANRDISKDVLRENWDIVVMPRDQVSSD